ncbi:hypothetical protein CKJ89_39720, partial [Klebsiella pneumoniae]
GYGAFFNATRSPRSALYAARRLLRHGWQRLRAGGADMAHFSMPPARRAPRCMPPAACCATAGSGYAP